MGEVGTTRRIAAAGFDWMCLDQQHGLLDRGRVAEILRGIGDDGPDIAVRVAALDAAAIGYALDVGATIVIIPMIEHADDARAAVNASLYPPRGRRSWGPISPLWMRAAPPAAEAHDRTRVWAMIETRGALEQLDEILQVDGLGGVFLGPNDLSLALGTTLDALLADSGADAPLPRIVAACRRAGLTPGAYAADAERTARLAELGFEYIAVTTDVAIVDSGAALALPGTTPAVGAY
jgi:4-hydroxy-2-oxoheptanedioate aldolase